jgi:hypothetical protein
LSSFKSVRKTVNSFLFNFCNNTMRKGRRAKVQPGRSQCVSTRSILRALLLSRDCMPRDHAAFDKLLSAAAKSTTSRVGTDSKAITHKESKHRGGNRDLVPIKVELFKQYKDFINDVLELDPGVYRCHTHSTHYHTHASTTATCIAGFGVNQGRQRWASAKREIAVAESCRPRDSAKNAKWLCANTRLDRSLLDI